MKFKSYLNEQDSVNEAMNLNIFKSLQKMGESALSKLLKGSFDKFETMIKDNGLEKKFMKMFNKQFKTNYKSLSVFGPNMKSKVSMDNFGLKSKSRKSKQGFAKFGIYNESDDLNEDWKNFLMFWKSETYPALAIFPTLQIWFQLDNLIDGAGLKDLDWKKIAIYGVLWMIIVTGQHVLLFNKWKKQNPGEWEAEGKPGVFKKGKK